MRRPIIFGAPHFPPDSGLLNLIHLMQSSIIVKVMRKPLVEIRDVTKIYESADGPIEALRSTTLNIGEGEFVSIVGPSGCGKTTLLKMAGGLLPVTSGSIHIRGQLVLEPRQDIGFMFQNPVLLPWKTTLENVLLPFRVHGRVSPEERQRASELLSLVGLSGFEGRYPYELSGGMQQRVAICRALVRSPSCLLLDEPFGALDALTREQMNVFFNRLWQKTGCTMVLVTHSIQEAVFLSNRVLVMSSRPGAVVDDVTIPFADDRRPEIIGTSQFGETSSLIRRHFNEAKVD